MNISVSPTMGKYHIYDVMCTYPRVYNNTRENGLNQILFLYDIKRNAPWTISVPSSYGILSNHKSLSFTLERYS